MRAVVSPDTPERWDFNCATYTDQRSFARALPVLDEAFAQSGVGGWAVRVPDGDREVVSLLSASGFEPEATGFAMGRELDEPIVPPEASGSPAIRRVWDLATAGWIYDVASGDRPGESFAALGALDPREHFLYLATRDGAPSSFLLGHDHEGDAVHWYVSTLAPARRRGLGRLLKLSALRDAQDRGCTTATSHATPSGAALGESCGYRRLASVTAWVRRFASRSDRAVPHGARAPV